MTTPIRLASGTIAWRLGQLAKKGDFVLGHRHNFHHDTVLLRGGMKVQRLKQVEFEAAADFVVTEDGVEKFLAIEDEREVYAGGDFPVIGIRAHVWHRLEALMDNTAYGCGYPNRSAIPPHEIIGDYDGWQAAFE